MCARGIEELQELSSEFRASGWPLVIEQGDALELDSFEASVKTLHSHLGGTDVLVNNVGGGGRWGSDSALSTDLSVWQEVMDKNFFATVRATQVVLESMVVQGFGRVVTIASRLGKEGNGRPWFVAAEAAQIAFSKSMSRDQKLVRNGVSFLCVAPGATHTDGSGWDRLRQDDADQYLSFTETLPIGRLLTADEVATVVGMMTGPAAMALNGACIAVDGGESIFL